MAGSDTLPVILSLAKLGILDRPVTELLQSYIDLLRCRRNVLQSRSIRPRPPFEDLQDNLCDRSVRHETNDKKSCDDGPDPLPANVGHEQDKKTPQGSCGFHHAFADTHTPLGPDTNEVAILVHKLPHLIGTVGLIDNEREGLFLL